MSDWRSSRLSRVVERETDWSENTALIASFAFSTRVSWSCMGMEYSLLGWFVATHVENRRQPLRCGFNTHRLIY
jgi:hypothetical protein